MNLDLNSSSKRSCIVLMCDERYVIPTLVAAKQARHYLSFDHDVIVYIDGGRSIVDHFEIFQTVSGANIRSVPLEIVEDIDRRVTNNIFRSHVSKAALLRLLIGEIVSENYDRVVYLDGDMQIRRSLSYLFEVNIKDGCVGAVPDWCALHSREGMPFSGQCQTYLSSLGIDPSDWGCYFNSGMMVANVPTWKNIGAEALRFLERHPELCRLHDQSALNHACQKRVIPLSVRWNYLQQYMAHPITPLIDPAILHFVGGLKPWDGHYKPWGREESQPYREMRKLLRRTSVSLVQKTRLRRIAYHLRPLFRIDPWKNSTYRTAMEKVLLSTMTD